MTQSPIPNPQSRPSLRTIASPPPPSPKALLNEAESCRLIAAQASLFAQTLDRRIGGGPLARAFENAARRAEWRLASIRKRMMATTYAPEKAA